MNDNRIEEQPYDDRHNTPPTPNPMFDLPSVPPTPYTPVDGEHIGNDHQERPRRVFEDGAEEVREQAAFWTHNPESPAFAEPPRQMPSRIPGQGLIHPHVAEHGVPSFGTGLIWRSPDGTVRHDLANFPWSNNRQVGIVASNIELRTIYAHLIEAATLARTEMRERGMQVDL